MTDLNEHWNSLFSSRTDPDLGWYESDVSQTLKFLDRASIGKDARVFLPGAGTSLLVDELLARGHELVLNDISDEALQKLKRRIGGDRKVTWLHHDISRPLPGGVLPVDLWIDRAVLHFLVEEDAIEGYFANVCSAVRSGGHVLLAEFSTEGATRCAGLAVHRYSVAEMQQRLGGDFELLEQEAYTYINPQGGQRPYIYALFARRNA